jgi:hypothetical protein
MLGTKRLDELVARLKSGSPASRDLAASEIADCLEADQLQEKELKTAVRSLIDAALAEKDPVVKESMFNALSSAEASRINWDPIAASLKDLDATCLEHALVILGFSGNQRYRPAVERYLRNPDETIRVTASEALALLDAGQKRICRG